MVLNIWFSRCLGLQFPETPVGIANGQEFWEVNSITPGGMQEETIALKLFVIITGITHERR